jgi:hypothetical protein
MDPHVYLLAVSVLVAYQTADGEPLTLNVELVNAAGLSDRLVKASQKEASRIFGATGVHLAWIQEPDRNPPAALKILITTDEFSTNNTHSVMWVLGKAPNVGDDHRRMAFVSYPSVLRASFSYRISAQQMLGAVIAYGLAHLLLPRGWHDRHGVMRQAWDSTDFQLLSLRQLGFAAVSASLLRAAVERTMHTSADLPTGAGATANDPRRNEP